MKANEKESVQINTQVLSRTTLPEFLSIWHSNVGVSDFPEFMKTVRGLTMIAFAQVNAFEYQGKTIVNKQIVKRLLEQGKELKRLSDVREKMSYQWINTYGIKKKNKKIRWITEYQFPLNKFMKSLSEALHCHLERHLRPSIRSCVKGTSNVTVAQEIHDAMIKDNSLNVGHLDIKNWFDSIHATTIEPVLGCYFGDYRGTNGKIVSTSKTLTELVVYKNRLPTGNPCSPLIANLVAQHTWLPSVEQYCDKNNLFLRVYVDNIVVTSKEGPIALYTHLTEISKLIQQVGYQTHKHSVFCDFRRQKILGLILNKTDSGGQVRIPIEMKKQIATIVHKFKKAHEQNLRPQYIINEWCEKYQGRKIYFPKDTKPIDKHARMYKWLIGQISWMMSCPRDRAKAETLMREALKHCHPYK